MVPEHAPGGLNTAADELIQVLEQMHPDTLADVRGTLAKAISGERRNARLGAAHVYEAEQRERLWCALDDLLCAVEDRAPAAYCWS